MSPSALWTKPGKPPSGSGGEEMDRARQEAENFVERARADIQRERDNAVEEVRASFGDLAITAAERVVRRSLDRQAHEELINQVLEEGESLRRG